MKEQDLIQINSILFATYCAGKSGKTYGELWNDFKQTDNYTESSTPPAALTDQDLINLDQWVEVYENLRVKMNLSDAIKELVKKVVEFTKRQSPLPVSGGVWEFSGDIDTIGKCANCGVEFHIHKENDLSTQEYHDILSGKYKEDDTAKWDIPDSEDTRNKRDLLRDLIFQLNDNDRLAFNILYTPTPSHTILNKQLDECIDFVNRMIVGNVLKYKK